MHAGCKCEHTNPHTQAETTQPQEQHHCRASQHDSSSNTDNNPHLQLLTASLRLCQHTHLAADTEATCRHH